MLKDRKKNLENKEDFIYEKRNSSLKIISIIIAVLIFLLASFLVYREYKVRQNEKIKTHNKMEEDRRKKIEEEKNKKLEEQKKLEEEKKISLIAGGDALIHDTVYLSARKNGTFDFKPKFRYIKDIVKDYDLAYYNQETILAGDELPLSNYPMFCSPTEVGDAYIDAGFNLVSLANNHTMDKGTAGVNASLRYWNKQLDKIMFHGSASSQEEADRIDIREKNGIKYTMLSYRMPELSNGLPNEFPYQVNDYTKERAKKDIEKIKDKVDLIIVAMHRGIENVDYRSEKQLETAKELAEMGVHLVIGNHSHVIQPIERINDTVVIYSLGNFISDQIPAQNLVGGLASMDIKLKNKKISIDNISARLIYTIKSDGYSVYPYNKVEENLFPGKDDLYNRFSKVLTSLSDEVKIIP